MTATVHTMNVYFLQPIRREDAERYVAAGWKIVGDLGPVHQGSLIAKFDGPDPVPA